jgi:hypothetical protein
MDAAAKLTADSLAASFPGSDVSAYVELLAEAFDTHPPPFSSAEYGDRYRECARDREWVALSLVANAQKEGEGARQLLLLAGECPEPATAEKIRLHAIDESRHADMYLALLGLVFPDAIIDETERAALAAISPKLRPNERLPAREKIPYASVLDEVVQMNIGEIRTCINQLLARPVLELLCPEPNRAKSSRLMQNLLADENSHIHYTATVLCDALRSGHRALVRERFLARVPQFNRFTWAEVRGEDALAAFAA